ncbi:uncharacterized protein CEXT_387041 [Caerostris extrusa]|uniref:Mitotic-spindle organizing protein 1 n=1 Tax=Caerostris extrusa TaxID=172846 RepID=A0AAV4P4Y8_CAEEX|nr:uncharacterized protein CEXT_387041 [Caerostris extrusa]
MSENNQHSKVSFYPQGKTTVLTSRDKDLYELCQLSSTPLEPELFKICIELLRMDVSPSALVDVLHNMATQVSNQNFVSKRNTQNRTSGSEKKKTSCSC